ncbi:MAG: heat-inducible transcriptional repressor HrcA [Lautropia sp.]|nr:heat-inducible transcriptional repressor HrcA [Lautropia sp.]
MDERARILLKSLIEHYIVDGQPVGSRTLSQYSRLDLSPATIRNVMAELEEHGLIAHRHTSSGRVPTPRGYRLFVDSLLTVQPLEAGETSQMQGSLVAVKEPRQVLAKAAGLLSSLSSFAGVVSVQRRAGTFRHIEFLRLSARRVLLILVSPDGEVHNRMLQVDHDYGPATLNEAANYINTHYAGVGFEEIKHRLGGELADLRRDISVLMQRAVDAGREAVEDDGDKMLIAGSSNFVGIPDFADDMARLKQLFGLFEQRSELLQLMDASARAGGVQIYIGGESEMVPMEELSIVIAPYKADGKIVGTLGVIGPTRMAYQRMIPMVDITARLVSSALDDGREE